MYCSFEHACFLQCKCITIMIIIKHHVVYGIWPMLICEVSYLVYLSFLLHWFDLSSIQAFFLVLFISPGVSNVVQISNSHVMLHSGLTVTHIVASGVQRCSCLGLLVQKGDQRLLCVARQSCLCICITYSPLCFILGVIVESRLARRKSEAEVG